MAAVSSEALAVVGEPDGGVVVLGAGEEQISFPVVLEESERPLVAFHQYRPHLLTLIASLQILLISRKFDSMGEIEQKNPNCSSTSPLEEERWKTKIERYSDPVPGCAGLDPVNPLGYTFWACEMQA